MARYVEILTDDGFPIEPWDVFPYGGLCQPLAERDMGLEGKLVLDCILPAGHVYHGFSEHISRSGYYW